MAGSGLQALREGREWLEGISRGSGVVGNGVETLPEDWGWSGSLLKGPGVVDRPSRRTRSGRETLA